MVCLLKCKNVNKKRINGKKEGNLEENKFCVGKSEVLPPLSIKCQAPYNCCAQLGSPLVEFCF
ncbi:unnamed protein product [Meloidogyne enterolobii]|uniref:Uncharacterized protein n=1 Tax=Meloidogyne enterolobii TaxID=390850 RepID=A0ACB0YW25_MELEN